MAYLNSDDMLLPDTLAYITHAFDQNPDVDLIYGNRIFIDSEGRDVGRVVLPQHDKRTLLWADYVPQETLFWRRRVWDRLGPFDENLHYALDWDFILRAAAAGFRFLRVPRFLACFRVHDQQKTAVMYDIGRGEMQQLRKRYLGFEPSSTRLHIAVAPYLARQFVYHWMYKAGILKY
jgi:hypothetical protein